MKLFRIVVLSALTLAVVLCLLFRYVLLDRLVIFKLSQVAERTGVYVTYRDLDFSFWTVRLNDIKVFYEDEPDPFATTDFIAVELLDQIAVVDDMHINRNGVAAAARGDVGLFDYGVDLKFSMPPSPCAALLGAVPESFKAELAGVKVEGQIALDLWFRLDPNKPGRNRLQGELENGCRLIEYGKVPPPYVYRKPFEHRALRPNKTIFKLETGPSSKRWARFDEISKYVRDAVVAAEDPLFYKHDGILLSRIKTAARINLENRSMRYGASTITMQTAKNLFLTREKRIERKLQELFFVWYLESNFSKDEILTLYLNIAEFGPSVYGIRDAAKYYFNTSPAQLNLRQAAFLAKLLPSPVDRSRAKTEGISPRQTKRIRRLLNQMKQLGQITEDEYEHALSKKIAFGKNAEPLVSEPVGMTNISRISRPRLKKRLPPESLLMSYRKQHGASLDNAWSGIEKFVVLTNKFASDDRDSVDGVADGGVSR